MSYPHRLDATQYAGYRPYFLTIGTRGRSCRFADGAVVAMVLSQILRAATDERFAVIAYCFMPDHLHMLVVGRGESVDLRRFVAAAKQRAAFGFARAFGGQLWQRNFGRGWSRIQPTTRIGDHRSTRGRRSWRLSGVLVVEAPFGSRAHALAQGRKASTSISG